MSDPREDIRNIAIPGDDSTIQEALVDLDRKLAAFTAAVRGAADRGRDEPAEQVASPQDEGVDAETMEQARKAAAARLLEPRARAGRKVREPVQESAAPDEVPQAEAPADEPRPMETAAGEAPSNLIAGPAAEDAEPAEQAASQIDQPVAQDGADCEDATAGEAAAPDEDPTEPQGDEALLASLDDATRKAVRVLRRLNPSKSLQELLEQLRNAPHEQHDRPANKSWFRFGR